MSINQRKEREKESLRQLILDTAREMFAEEGYANVSMRKIADEIEYSPTTIYLYFKDKHDLLNQVCEETFARLGKKLEAIGRKYEGIEGLRRGLLAYVEFGLKHPKHYEVTFMLPIKENIGETEYQFAESLGEKAFEYLRISVSNCIELGEIEEGNVDLISQTLWAGIHGITSLLIGHENFPFVSKKALINSVIDTMINGLVFREE